MNAPPLEADGARVLAAATLSGLPVSGRIRHTGPQTFAGLLMAQYAGSENEVYLFYTDAAWDVRNDTIYISREEAEASAEAQFPGVRDRWRSVG